MSNKSNYLTIFLLIHSIQLILTIESITSDGSNTTTQEEYVVCDQKKIPGIGGTGRKRLGTNRESLCKVECHTKLNNPGFCQVHALYPCKTLDIKNITSDSIVKCKRNNQKDERFASICCPFKPETQTEDNSVINSVNNTIVINTTTTTTTTTTPIINSVNKFECGKRPDIAAIVGGISAQPNTWPWIVSVYERQSPTSRPRFLCGGAIINERYILSAAHCFVRYGSIGSPVRANRFFIKVGAHRLSDANIQFREVSHVIPHKDYNGVQHYHDIALIKMRHKIEFIPTVQPICLPSGHHFDASRKFVGNVSKLVGWGAIRFGGPVSDELREVDVNIMDTKACNKNYTQILGHETGFPGGINSQMMCAGVIGGGKDSCQGDSGGPLALAIDGKWYELGIVSFGYKCAEPGFPGIYTRVQHFMDWIQLNIK